MAAAEQLIDWDTAVATGVRLVKPGPAVSPAEAARAVADLRRFAVESREIVAGYTQLHAPTDDAGVLVVDRPNWIRANAGAFRIMLEPVVEKVSAKRGEQPAGGLMTAVGSKVTGAETGAILAFLAAKVLGQFELFPPEGIDSTRPGRLLLVAPNIVKVEQELAVDPRDFRFWVCLHEETHRVQFGHAPWLRDHILGLLHEYLDATELDSGELLRRISASASTVGDAVRGRGDGSLMTAMQTPEQREVLDRVTAVMSLLEGHADFVMDAVGRSVIPSVDLIRERFTQRREQAGFVDTILRRLLGFEAKLKQYREGAIFVRGVVEQVGMERFNTVWRDAGTLPTRAEILDPAAWVARVHGPDAALPA